MGQATGFCIKLWLKRRRLPLISSGLRWSKAKWWYCSSWIGKGWHKIRQISDEKRGIQFRNFWKCWKRRRLIIDAGILVPWRWRWWYHHSDQVYCKTTSIWRKHHQHIRRWPFHEPWGMLFACCKLQHFGKHPKKFHHFSAAVRKSNPFYGNSMQQQHPSNTAKKVG